MSSRQLARTLSQSELKNLSEQDKVLIGQLRNAVEGVHGKFEELRDGMDERYVLKLYAFAFVRSQINVIRLSSL